MVLKLSKPAGQYLIAATASALIAILFFGTIMVTDMMFEERNRAQLIDMADSFVTVFSNNRDNGSMVPATFRRLGIEHFSQSATGASSAHMATTVRMPGVPGLEIGSFEQDPRLRDIIARFQHEAVFDPIVEHRFEGNKFVGRTIFPSVASSESCVNCHNSASYGWEFKIGDVMGAYIVETDLTHALKQNAKFALVALVIAALLSLQIAKKATARMQVRLDGLQTQFKLEKTKRDAAEKEKFLLSHDALTGIPNRKMFHEKLQRKLESSEIGNQYVALIDVDDFKHINDTFGHAAGDAVLVEISKRIVAIAAPYDGIVARLGGDEFVAHFARGSEWTSIENAGQQLIDALIEPIIFDGNVLYPKCSVGIVCVNHAEKQTIEQTMKHADAALYAVKASGKNGFRIMDDEILSQVERKEKIAAYLPVAIEKDEIQIALQPQICFETGRLNGFEALARLSMDGEPVQPSEFVPIAEQIGVVRQVDMGVFRAAAKFSRNLKEKYGMDVPFSVNISSANFNFGSLQQDVLRIVALTGISPSLITLEITESLAIQNWHQVNSALKKLRRVGFRTSIDDFGTGYSSIAYLKESDFDEIKVDKKFVERLEQCNKTQFLLKSVIDLSKGLGCKVVVEGIETEEQAHIIKRSGASIAQGYLFGRPLSQEHAEKMVLAFGKLANRTRRFG